MGVFAHRGFWTSQKKKAVAAFKKVIDLALVWNQDGFRLYRFFSNSKPCLTRLLQFILPPYACRKWREVAAS